VWGRATRPPYFAMKVFLTPRVLLTLLFAVVFWASAFAGIRAGLQSYPPAHLAIVRFLVASAVLVLYAALSHFRRPELKDLAGFALTGLLGITYYNLALNYGETNVTAGTASLLIASTPVWTAISASIGLRERLSTGDGSAFSSASPVPASLPAARVKARAFIFPCTR